VTFDPTGALLASTGANKTARLWRVPGWTLARELEEAEGQVVDAAFGPQGGSVAIVSTAGDGAVYRSRSGRLGARVGHSTGIVDVAFDSTGFRLATASKDRTARVWASEDGYRFALLAGHSDTVRAVGFVPGERYVVTAADDGTARVWEVDARPQLRVSRGRGPDDPALIATSPDGSVTARASGHVVLLDEGGRRRELRGHRDDVTSVAFSPDGTRLVTGSSDHDAIVWDLAAGRPVSVLRAHSSTVADARFSPDGRWIVTAGPTTAGVWSASTGTFVGFLRGPTEPPVRAAAFTPDSRSVVTVEPGGTVRRASCEICVPLDELVQLADTRLAATGRQLTDEQRRGFLDD
jgi:WD40 repeat protein